MSAALQLDARLAAFAEFRSIARSIWRNADEVPVELSTEEPAPPRALASVSTLGMPKSFAWLNIIANPKMTRTLRLSKEALALPADALRRILIHEAVHLGIGGHGPLFRTVCARHGGALTGADALGTPVRVERKERGRYRPLREFPRESLNEARAFMREQVKSTGIRHRITY